MPAQLTSPYSLGWRDEYINLRPRGTRIPALSQLGSGPFWLEKFQLLDELHGTLHFNHDYAQETPAYIHVHWTSDGTNTQPIKWEFVYTIAKGHDQSNYAEIASGITTVGQQSIHLPAAPWRHYTTEMDAPGIAFAKLEPDTNVIIRLRRISNNAIDNTDGIFFKRADLHYQSNRTSTLSRVPDFYT